MIIIISKFSILRTFDPETSGSEVSISLAFRAMFSSLRRFL